MKNFNHPEFHILHELQLLQDKYPEIPELRELKDKVKSIINENAISIMQYANLYTLLGQDGDLFPETKEKLANILESASKFCGKK